MSNRNNDNKDMSNKEYRICPNCKKEITQEIINRPLFNKKFNTLVMGYTCRYCPSVMFTFRKIDIEKFNTLLWRKHTPSKTPNARDKIWEAKAQNIFFIDHPQ